MSLLHGHLIEHIIDIDTDVDIVNKINTSFIFNDNETGIRELFLALAVAYLPPRMNNAPITQKGIRDDILKFGDNLLIESVKNFIDLKFYMEEIMEFKLIINTFFKKYPNFNVSLFWKIVEELEEFNDDFERFWPY